MITQNGNRWIGPGHHAFLTDAAGQDHIVYHAIDRGTPWLTDPFGINRRPMLIDRIDWIDGWPRTRAGLGPSRHSAARARHWIGGWGSTRPDPADRPLRRDQAGW